MSKCSCSRARKYAKWWSQCFLTGIERILLGFRDEYGVVRQIQPLLVKDIETRAVSCLISLLFRSKDFSSSEHGVRVHSLPFSMNSVDSFERQSPKITSKTTSRSSFINHSPHSIHI